MANEPNGMMLELPSTSTALKESLPARMLRNEIWFPSIAVVEGMLVINIMTEAPFSLVDGLSSMVADANEAVTASAAALPAASFTAILPPFTAPGSAPVVVYWALRAAASASGFGA